MQVDNLVLGRVKFISKFHFEVSLPNEEVGKVQINDVSDKYTEVLNEVISTGELKEDVPSLSDMFYLGQLVRCAVKKTTAPSGGDSATDPSYSRRYHALSVNPKDVNKHILKRHLRSYTCFVGAVCSEEDHGYTIDSGIQGLLCFLPRENVYGKLFVGGLVTLRPLVLNAFDFRAAGPGRVLKVSMVSDGSPDLTIGDSSPVHFVNLLPGVWVRASIHKKVGSTLIARFSDCFISINRAHYKGDGSSYKLQDEVVVCVISVDPGNKQLSGSLLPHLLPSAFASASAVDIIKEVPVGTKLSDAVVERVDKRTILFRVPGMNKTYGVIRSAHLPSDKMRDNLKSSYSVGQKITCRVIDHDLLENVVIATMRPKLLKLPFLSIHELSPGDIVPTVIKRFTKNGVVVRIAGRLNGFVPYLHLSDVPLKRPSESFGCGDELKCCVLVLDKGNDKAILTAKRGLVEAVHPLFGSNKMLEILADSSKPRSESLFTAFVTKVSERGLLISGLSDQRGWLPRSETGLESADVLQTTFFRGQVIRVRVLRILKAETDDEDDGAHRSRYLVSLKLKGTTETTWKQRNSKATSHIEIGQIFNATVSKIQTNGLKVDLYNLPTCGDQSVGPERSSKIGSAFLGFTQISDQETNGPLFSQFMKNIKSGSTLDLDRASRPVVVINKTVNTLIVSARPSLLRAAAGGQKLSDSSADSSQSEHTDERESTGFVHNFEDLRVGSQWFAWVLNHVDYGIFVEFPSGIRGLAPTRFLTDTRAPKNVNWSELFPTGCTVVAKVLELAPPEKRRCLVSLRMMDTYYAEDSFVGDAIRSLERWLTEREWISQRHESLSGFRIGDQINFRVNDLDTMVVVGEASKASSSADTGSKAIHWVPAFSHLVNTEKVECASGSIYPGIVSFVDFQAARLEVVLSTWLIHSINNRKENAASELRDGQKVSSVVIALQSRDAAVLAFRGHAAGRLGLTPTRRSFNDVLGGNSWCIGQKNQVTLRRSFDQRGSSQPLYLCTLSIHDPVPQSLGSTDHAKQSSLDDIFSAEPVNLTLGTSISGLRFSRIVRNIVFFQLPQAGKRFVFCHLLNIDNTAKALHEFQAHPPRVGAVMQRNATVVHTASEDTHVSSSGKSDFSSRLVEVSFLDKTDASVGDVVCAQIVGVHRDFWSLRLPGGAKARLHITGMIHGKQPLPLPLNAKEANNKILRTKKGSANLIKKHQFITCRVVDRVDLPREASEAEPNTTNENEAVYFVTTKPDVIRGGLNNWEKQKPVLGQTMSGFIKIRSPHGLLVSLTHADDMLVPFVADEKTHATIVKIRFRVGDHLCVRPLGHVEGHLIGELVFEKQKKADEEPNILPESNLLTSKTVQELIKDIKTKKIQIERRTKSFVKVINQPLSIHDNDSQELLTGLQNQAKKRSLEPDASLSLPKKRRRTVSESAMEVSTSATPVVGERDSHSQKTCVRDERSSTTPVYGRTSEERSLKRIYGERSRRKSESEIPTQPPVQVLDENSWTVGNPELISKYARYMLPADFEDQSNKTEEEQKLTETVQETTAFSAEGPPVESAAAAEWRLREKELRKAMLAALTSEQRSLPKGSLRPSNTEEFELTVRNAPSSAACWAAYMTHVLSIANKNSLADARALAERGLRAIQNCAGLSPSEQDTELARLLIFYLVMEAKELERCSQQQQSHIPSTMGTDSVIEMNEQANRLSQVLARLVNLDQPSFTRRAIDTLADIGQYEHCSVAGHEINVKNAAVTARAKEKHELLVLEAVLSHNSLNQHIDLNSNNAVIKSQRAEELARKLIKSSPSDPDRWLSLIRVRFRAGRVAAAREAQRNGTCILRSVHLPRFITSVARLEFEFGDVDRAVSVFREQLTVHPKQRLIYEEFIRVLLLAGKIGEAEKVKEKAKEMLKSSEFDAVDALFTKATKGTQPG